MQSLAENGSDSQFPAICPLASVVVRKPKASVRRACGRRDGQLQEPVLVVGAGQGLIVAEIRKKGIRCDGVDWSAEMVKFAKLRRGIDLIQAEGSALPIADGAYATVLYAPGVIDFMADERAIAAMLREGRRVAKDSGKMLIAFYKAKRCVGELYGRRWFAQG